MDPSQSRIVTVEESSRSPPLDLMLAFGAMLPLAAGAIAVWLTDDPLRGLLAQLTVLWGGAILVFLSGVRRGLSFRTPGGPSLAQIVTMAALFTLGALGILAASWAHSAVASVALLVGYGLVLALDPVAARLAEAPLSFARLRPVQIPIALVSLAAVLLRALG